MRVWWCGAVRLSSSTYVVGNNNKRFVLPYYSMHHQPRGTSGSWSTASSLKNTRTSISLPAFHCHCCATAAPFTREASPPEKAQPHHFCANPANGVLQLIVRMFAFITHIFFSRWRYRSGRGWRCLRWVESSLGDGLNNADEDGICYRTESCPGDYLTEGRHLRVRATA